MNKIKYTKLKCSLNFPFKLITNSKSSFVTNLNCKRNRNILNDFIYSSNKNKFVFNLSKKFTSVENRSTEENEKPEEEAKLREIQLNPRYEAAISLFVTGDYDKALSSLYTLRKSLLEERKHINEDYLFLLRKIISIDKVNKSSANSLPILKEIKEVSIKLYKSDFNYLFDNLEYIVINLIHIDQSEAISFIDNILNESLLPGFFDHIFKYYQGSAYILQGKNLEKGVEILNSIEKDLEDDYLKGCVYNNKAVAMWWLTTSKYIKEMEKSKGISLEIIQNLAKDMLEVTKTFKQALILIEEIKDFKYEDKYEFKENSDDQRTNYLKYLLCNNFDRLLKLDPKFLKSFGEYKDSLTEIKTSALIFSNVAELLYNIKDYKKSLLFLNAANLYYQKYNKNDQMFYKNLALVAMNNWKLTYSPESPKAMFDKILGHMKGFSACYEKVFIFRIYGEMLLEENPRNVLGNNLIIEAGKIEENLANYESRRGYLTLPSEI